MIERAETMSRLLTFHDLIELYFVREFRKANVTLPEVRNAARILREEWNTPYPFALNKLAEIDGRLIHKQELQTVLEKQQVFEFARDFFKNFDFDENGLASAWYPLGMDKLIVLDPKRSFGAPIETRSGTRTDVLYQLYQAENGDVEAVANWYEVPIEAVEQAIKFEEKWRKVA
ncbi:MAG: hypothetical protein KIT45_12960 [Fimbriimonadia bacterium]|nr:hypothetical protein [Fimbriimonadia bacterium]